MTDEFKTGLILSVLLHGGLAVAAVMVGDLWRQPPPSAPVPIEVALVEEVAEESAVPDPAPAQPEPEPEPEPEQPVSLPEEVTAPEPVSEPEPLPEPAPEDTPDAVPEPTAEPAPDPPEEPRSDLARTVVVRDKPKPPERFDPDKIAALIDKSAEDQPPPDPLADIEQELEKARRKQAAVDRMARQAQATIRDYLRQKVQGCWSIPAGARDAQELQVVLRIQLDPYGRLRRPPSVVGAGNLSAPGQEFRRIFAESAQRAIQRCAPYKIPVDDYNQWKEIEFVFDARELLGG
ncbi:MAG: hypothetical protein ACFB22_06350 [Rhodothalassiaceae bacterium]